VPLALGASHQESSILSFRTKEIRVPRHTFTAIAGLLLAVVLFLGLVRFFSPQSKLVETNQVITTNEHRGTLPGAASETWAGYEVKRPAQIFSVSATFDVPYKHRGTTPPLHNEIDTAAWVGISNETDLLQAGTDSTTQTTQDHGAYWVWYEDYPQPAYVLKDFPIKPNDRIHISVVAGDPAIISYHNLSTGQSEVLQIPGDHPPTDYADFIIEYGYYNWGNVTFSRCRVNNLDLTAYHRTRYTEITEGINLTTISKVVSNSFSVRPITIAELGQ
jgi:hypothetical protein